MEGWFINKHGDDRTEDDLFTFKEKDLLREAKKKKKAFDDEFHKNFPDMEIVDKEDKPLEKSEEIEKNLDTLKEN